MMKAAFPFILSHFQTKALWSLRGRGKTVVSLSLDLGLSEVVVQVDGAGVQLPDGQQLAWSAIKTINKHENACYEVVASEIVKVQFFSEWTSRTYSLMPTMGAPTMLVAGFPMHRIKGTEPHLDTLSKIKAVGGVTGRVLDTTMGLGYTAIEAAKTAVAVTTLELDPTVVEVCRLNPWSRALFNNPHIERRLGDACAVVPTLADRAFDVVIHDPPTFSLAGELYSAAFYEQVYRVLEENGRFFHYIGDPNSRSGSSVTRSVCRRLQAVGFRKISKRPQAYGVLAYK